MGDLERADPDVGIDSELLVRNLETMLNQKDDEIIRINRHCEYIMELYYDLEERLARKTEELLTFKVHQALCRCHLSDDGAVQIPMERQSNNLSFSGSEVYPAEGGCYGDNTSGDLSEDDTLRHTGTSHSGRFNSVSSPDEKQMDTLARMRGYTLDTSGLMDDSPLFPELHRSMSLDRPLSIALSDVSSSSAADVLNVEHEHAHRRRRGRGAGRGDAVQGEGHGITDTRDSSQVVDALVNDCSADAQGRRPANGRAACDCLEADEGSCYDTKGRMNHCQYCLTDADQITDIRPKSSRGVPSNHTFVRLVSPGRNRVQTKTTTCQENEGNEASVDFGEHAHLVSARRRRPKAVGYTFDILPSKTKPKLPRPPHSAMPTRIPKPLAKSKRTGYSHSRQLPTKPVIHKPRAGIKPTRKSEQFLMPYGGGMRKARSAGNIRDNLTSDIPMQENIFTSLASSLQFQRSKTKVTEKHLTHPTIEYEDSSHDVHKSEECKDVAYFFEQRGGELYTNDRDETNISKARHRTTQTETNKNYGVSHSQTYTKEEIEESKMVHSETFTKEDIIPMLVTQQEYDEEGMNRSNVVHSETYTKEDMLAIKQVSSIYHSIHDTPYATSEGGVHGAGVNSDNHCSVSSSKATAHKDNVTKSHATSIWSENTSVQNGALVINSATNDDKSLRDTRIITPESTLNKPHTDVVTNRDTSVLPHDTDRDTMATNFFAVATPAFFHPEIPTPIFQNGTEQAVPMRSVRSRSRPLTPTGYYDEVKVKLQRPLTSDPSLTRRGRKGESHTTTISEFEYFNNEKNVSKASDAASDFHHNSLYSNEGNNKDHNKSITNSVNNKGDSIQIETGDNETFNNSKFTNKNGHPPRVCTDNVNEKINDCNEVNDDITVPTNIIGGASQKPHHSSTRCNSTTRKSIVEQTRTIGTDLYDTALTVKPRPRSARHRRRTRHNSAERRRPMSASLPALHHSLPALHHSLHGDTGHETGHVDTERSSPQRESLYEDTELSNTWHEGRLSRSLPYDGRAVQEQI